MQGQIYPRSGGPQLSYQRPSDWLPLPAVNQGEEKFVGLFAVYNTQSNFIALQFEGNYTVDWGDGTIENFTSGLKAEHVYDYATIPPSTLTSRGYRQVVVSVVPQTGHNLTSLDLSVPHNNSPVPIPGYAIPPSSPWLDIAIGMPYGTFIQLFSGDLHLGSLEIARIIDAGYCTSFYNLFIFCTSLAQVVVEKMDAVEDMSYMFEGCPSLFSVSLPDCPNLAYADYPFYSCLSLKEVSIGDVSNLASFSYFFSECGNLEKATIKKVAGSAYAAFEYCYSLKSVNILDPSALTDTSSMFYECYSLENLYLLPTPLVTDTEYMFSSCYSLKHVKISNLDSVLTTDDTFFRCYALTHVELPSLSTANSVSSMFYYCTSLQSVSLSSIPLATSLDYLFYGCTGLTDIIIPEISPGSSMVDIVQDSYGLQKVSILGQPGNCNGSFRNCGNLRSVVFEDCSIINGALFAFAGCYQLSKLRVPNLSYSLELSDCALSRDALVQTFGDLATVSAGSRVIGVGGNWGAPLLSAADIQIATDKGWIVEFSPCDYPPFSCNTSVKPYCVTDFSYAWYNCSSLTTFPGTLYLSSGENFSYAWFNCYGLTTFPGTLNLSSGTNFYYAWGGCIGLTSFPGTLDLSSGTNFRSAWDYCTGLTSFPGTLDLSSGTSFQSTWSYCTGLTSFPGTLNLSSGTNFRETWGNCTSLTSFPGTLNLSSGTNFSFAWNSCTSLTSFPGTLNLSSGVNFNYAWFNCTSLTSFPAGMFDTCQAVNFLRSWENCALDQTSVDNILVSINAAGTSNGILGLNGGTSASPSPSGAAAKSSLEARGWTVTTN